MVIYSNIQVYPHHFFQREGTNKICNKYMMFYLKIQLHLQHRFFWVRLHSVCVKVCPPWSIQVTVIAFEWHCQCLSYRLVSKWQMSLSRKGLHLGIRNLNKDGICLYVCMCQYISPAIWFKLIGLCSHVKSLVKIGL